jgi:hypothetical protein
MSLLIYFLIGLIIGHYIKPFISQISVLFTSSSHPSIGLMKIGIIIKFIIIGFIIIGIILIVKSCS